MVLFCRYKPCALWILLYGLISFLMVIFTIAVYVFIGGFYPSFRSELCWHWSLGHHTMSFFLSLATAVVIYQNILSIFWNRTFLLLQLFLCVSAGALSATIWPVISRHEFYRYLRDEYQDSYHIPPFMNWFQFAHGCCGVNNYKDYIHYGGTQRKIEKYYAEFIIDRSSPNFVYRNPDAPVPPPNAKRTVKVVFNVPRSCCSLSTRNHSGCGLEIDYTNIDEIKQRLNTVTRGCYDHFVKLIYEYQPTQITAMYVIFRTYPLIDICFHLLSFYIHAYYYDKNIKAIHAPDYEDEDWDLRPLNAPV